MLHEIAQPLDPHRHPLVKYWGLASDCPNHWEKPLPKDRTLDTVFWLHLGREKRPRSCREFVSGRPKELTTYAPFQTRWTFVLQILGKTEAELQDLGYFIKIPGAEEPLEVRNEGDWKDVMGTVSEKLATSCSWWCKALPPVLLICTAEQARRCEAKKWRNAVVDEYCLCFPGKHMLRSSQSPEER